MKGNKSLVWALAALVVFGISYWSTRPDYGPTERGELVAGTPASVDRLEITGRDGKTVNLTDVDGKWEVLVESEGGGERSVAADGALVGEAIGSFLGAEILDTVSTNKERHGVFGVGDGEGTLVVAKKGKTDVAALLIGNVDSTGMNTYVRLKGDARVVTMAGRLKTRFNRSAEQWREKRIASFDPHEVARVTVEAGDDSFTLRRTGGGGWEVVAGATGAAEQLQPDAPEAFLAALGSLRARSFLEGAVPEDASVVLKLAWERREEKSGGSVAFYKDPADGGKILVPDAPGGDVAVLDVSDLAALKKKPGDFARVQSRDEAAPVEGTGKEKT